MIDYPIPLALSAFTIASRPFRRMRRRSAQLELQSLPGSVLMDVGLDRGDIVFATTHGCEVVSPRIIARTKGATSDDPRE